MRLGLTGGIGCGKSTAGTLLGNRGFRRLDSDAIVRHLLTENPAIIEATVEHFGPEVRAAPGGIDRSILASKVFNNPPALAWLEALLHPVVGQIWQGHLAEHPEANWVVEIPLLFEKRLENHFDFTVCVACSETLQLQRLARKHLNEAQAKARMERQMPLSEKVKQSDFVLYNNGTLAFLERQIEALIQALVK